MLAGYLPDVHSVCVCVGGGVIILLAGYLPDVHSVCVCGGVIILLAGDLPDVHSVCVCVGGVILLAGYLPDVHSVCGGGSFCLLVIYLMSIVWEWEGVRGHHSACWLPT